ncbi:IS3 family transposase [Spirosoma validum]|uniref:IS3 family transposase n=1 Tax=Spirosoma validum TaxID=2771355 RepID=A0A927B4S9_9BACT|nr:IS3 family transposase [Spirosoma validum]MBD2755298.1 IS3 family transposase [Spirosoma validum]
MLTNHPNIAIRRLEDVLGFTRQGYYQYWQRQNEPVDDDLNVLRLVRPIRRQHPRIGGRKLYYLLQKEFLERGIKLGRDAFFELLARHKMLIRRRRRKVKTTFSGHPFRKYPNLIKNLVVERPNQLWVSDITYWFTQGGCLYVSLVTDAYSKRIMGYAVAPTLGAIHCKTALEMALKKIKKRTAKALIHHSDRGLQYCSAIYIGLLDNYHVQISMTETGDPLENPIAERVNGILKNEYLAHRAVYSLAQAELVLEQAVIFYNYKRPHMSCDMLVPDQAHQGEGKLKRRWKNYYSKRQVG